MFLHLITRPRFNVQTKSKLEKGHLILKQIRGTAITNIVLISTFPFLNFNFSNFQFAFHRICDIISKSDLFTLFFFATGNGNAQNGSWCSLHHFFMLLDLQSLGWTKNPYLFSTCTHRTDSYRTARKYLLIFTKHTAPLRKSNSTLKINRIKRCTLLLFFLWRLRFKCPV